MSVLRPCGLLSNAWDSIPHGTLVFILYPLRKAQYYEDYFSSNRSNMKKTWKSIKEIIGFKKGSFNIPSKIISMDNVELTNCKSIAHAFN